VGRYLAPDKPAAPAQPVTPEVEDEAGEPECSPDEEPEVPVAPAPLPAIVPPPRILKWDLFHVNTDTGKRIRFAGNHELTYEVAEQRARVRRMAQFNAHYRSAWTIEAYPIEDAD
jgi:hypothetical protein